MSMVKAQIAEDDDFFSLGEESATFSSFRTVKFANFTSGISGVDEEIVRSDACRQGQSPGTS